MGKQRNRRWSLEEKRRVVERMESCRHQDLADELEVDRRQLYAWRMQVRCEAEGPVGEGREQQLEREVRQLREALGRKVMEADFLRVPCEESRLDAKAAEAVAKLHLRRNRASRAGARTPQYRVDVPCGWSQPSRILS